MLGGGNGNPAFPVFLEKSPFRYNNDTFPKLQLFGDIGCNIDPPNYVGNDQGTATSRSMKRGREFEPIPRQQKLPIALNNNFVQDEAGHGGSILNLNPVSTGLKLSYEEDERNSSITSAGENMQPAIPSLFSISSSVKTEYERQNEELDHYIRLQEENLTRGARDLNQRHADSFVNTLEKVVSKKIREKEFEIENMNHKNKELGEKIKQVALEVRSWHHRAKYNESIVSVLRSNLQQVLAQDALQPREGCGESEFDDAVSSMNYQGIANGSGIPLATNQLNCKACKAREVSVLLLPCRHLCLCKDCGGVIEVCPVCQVMKTASMQVYMA